MDEVSIHQGTAKMGKMTFTRSPTRAELEAMRAKANAKAAAEAKRLSDAVTKAVADAEAQRLAKAAAEAKQRDALHPVDAFGINERFFAVNIVWHEWSNGTTHVEAITTGFVPKDREGFADIKACVDATLEFHAEHGERYSKFYVYEGDKRIGSGFFDSNVTAADIPYLFAALAARGFEGHVAYVKPRTGSLLLDDSILAKLAPIVEDVASFENVEAAGFFENFEPGAVTGLIDGTANVRGNETQLSVLNSAVSTFRAAYLMPAFGSEPFSMGLRHGYDAASPVEYLRFDANEKLPDRFAALWHAERDRYRTILASCPARNFLVYDIRDTTEGPMAIYQMRGDFPHTFHNIGEAVASDGEGGGFVATAHGSFLDDPPSAETLAFISCRLAATGRWLVLVPHQYDFVTPEIHALMSGTEICAE
jgi:hypothetical protein